MSALACYGNRAYEVYNFVVSLGSMGEGGSTISNGWPNKVCFVMRFVCVDLCEGICVCEGMYVLV